MNVVTARIPLPGGKRLSIHVLPTDRALQRAWRASGKSKNGVEAFYTGWTEGTEFGAIWMRRGRVTPGTLAHEMTHFLCDWIRRRPGRKTKKRVEEKLARLMDYCTEEFWKAYKPTLLERIFKT